MLDTIIVAAIVVIAAVFIGRRLFRQLTAKESTCGCGCGGCDQTSCCSSAKDGPDKSDGSDCCGSR